MAQGRLWLSEQGLDVNPDALILLLQAEHQTYTAVKVLAARWQW